MIKRLLDILVAIIGFLVAGPILLVVTILIYFIDGPPVLFSQCRVGLHGQIFRLHKFRTMNHSISAEKGAFDAGKCNRVTELGKILRKTKLDELPQLWNVFQGDMTVVGPRPEVPGWVTVYPDRWEKVLQVKPGITDNASIEFRNEEGILASSDDPEKTYRDAILPRKLDLYEAYVASHSLSKDLIIILRTVAALFR